MTSFCESSSIISIKNNKSNKNINIGLADEDDDTENNDTPNTILLQDGMDASVGDGGDDDVVVVVGGGGGGSSDVSSGIISSTSSSSSSGGGPADADDDDNQTNDVEEEEDDDPSNDEETTCSICLINRRGPCRKYWLKFEKCMKEHHGAEKKKKKKETSKHDVKGTKKAKEEEVGNGDGNGGNHVNDDSSSDESSTSTSLAERCDRHMIPWIECIQRHRNTYSLISNEFYQRDYIDPLEYSIPDERRALFDALSGGIESKEEQIENKEDIDNNDGIRSGNGGYMVKFNGVEIDLESWKEHIDAETDDDDDDDATENGNVANSSSTGDDDGPHLINASAKFRLMDPNYSKASFNDVDKYDGGRIEVAYIKDQRGRLLGFDSFNSAKKDMDVDSNNINQGEEEDASNAVGECTFHIVPGETTSIVAYAIYRGTTTTTTNGEGQGSRSGGTILREDVLYHTPEIPLPGISTK
ncbi:hypothetical protein ACHAWU_006698 [Discostella pseudostelligera]|uniref:Uncharacterized protein n=1 Tax=Discostella pseudostelligera TaxID=259834 RepID=A0ABD3MWL6_9STRA